MKDEPYVCLIQNGPTTPQSNHGSSITWQSWPNLEPVSPVQTEYREAGKGSPGQSPCFYVGSWGAWLPNKAGRKISVLETCKNKLEGATYKSGLHVPELTQPVCLVYMGHLLQGQWCRCPPQPCLPRSWLTLDWWDARSCLQCHWRDIGCIPGPPTQHPPANPVLAGEAQPGKGSWLSTLKCLLSLCDIVIKLCLSH